MSTRSGSVTDADRGETSSGLSGHGVTQDGQSRSSLLTKMSTNCDSISRENYSDVAFDSSDVDANCDEVDSDDADESVRGDVTPAFPKSDDDPEDSEQVMAISERCESSPATEKDITPKDAVLPEEESSQKDAVLPEEQSSLKDAVLPEEESSLKDAVLPEEESSLKDAVLPEEESSLKDAVLPEEESSLKDAVLPEEESSLKDAVLPEEESSQKDAVLPEEESSQKDAVLPEEESSLKDTVLPEEQSSLKDTVLPEEQSSLKDAIFTEEESSQKDAVLPEEESSQKDTVLSEEESSLKDTVLPEEESSLKDTVLPEKESSQKDAVRPDEEIPPSGGEKSEDEERRNDEENPIPKQGNSEESLRTSLDVPQDIIKEGHKTKELKENPESEKNDTLPTDTENENKTNENPTEERVDGVPSDLDERLEQLKSSLERQKTELMECHLRDYSRFSDLTSLLESVGDTVEGYEEDIGSLYDRLHQIRTLIGEMSAIVDKKLTEDGLHTWIRRPKSNTDDKVAEKRAVAEATEARLRAVEVHRFLLEVEEKHVILEAEAAEAKREAEAAAEEARLAAKHAEEARIASEEKVKDDERARLEAEEEDKRKEQLMRLNVEETRRKSKESQFLATPAGENENESDDQLLDTLRKLPKYIYRAEPADITIPISCVLRAEPRTLPSQSSVSVRCLDQRACAVDLSNNQELVSRIIKIEKNDSFQIVEPMALAIPHVASRNLATREPVIKRLNPDGSWTELDTYEVFIQDLKEYKFVETRLFDIEATFAVVTRPRREILTVTRKGGKLSPSVDVRICFAFRPMTFKTATNLQVEVQPVELTLVSELKYRKPVECDNLLASSPIIQFELPAVNLPKPMTIIIPVPPNPNKSRRPLTALSERDTINGKGSSRPVSALSFGKDLSVSEDILHFLTWIPGEGWTVYDDIHLIQSKNNDSVSIELTKPITNRFMIIRTRGCVRHREAERIGAHIDNATRERTVQMILRQRSDDPRRVTLHCVSIAKSERYQRKLKEDGYDVGPPPSGEIILHEGEKIKLGFRGNIRDLGVNDDNINTELVFNTHILTTKQFIVGIIDRFSQKCLDSYRGFCQLFVRGMVPKKLSKEEEKAKASQPMGHQKRDLMEGDILLCELLITLPKPEPETPKPIVNRAPIQFKSQDILDNDYLRYLSTVIGDEWRTLAQYLGIRRMRIQAILRNSVTLDTDAVIYDMLATWAKRIPRSVNKVELLCRALISSGRVDLADQVRDKQNQKHLENMNKSRDAYLRKGFIKIAQRLPIMNEWRRLAKGLGLRSEVINRIDDKDAGVREKVTRCLNIWLEKNGDKANIMLLLNVLRKCQWTKIASEIQSELGVY